MPALTIRNLPDGVHTRLRALAGDAQVSVEAFVRRILAEATAEKDRNMSPTGFAEASQPFIHAAAGAAAATPPELWGALKGSVFVASQTDLTTSSGEHWAGEDWGAPS